MEGLKLLLVQDVDPQGGPQGEPFVAADGAGAGVGEVVLYTAGSSARYTTASHDAPVDHLIVGIVDAIDLGSRRTYDKAAQR